MNSIVYEALRHASVSCHHPACPIATGRGHRSVTHDDCTCHVAKAERALKALDEPIRFELNHYEKAGVKLRGKIEIGSQGLNISFEGFGTASVEGGAPIFVEPDEHGNPVVYLFADITKDDFTDKVILDGAKEAKEPNEHDPQNA